MKNVNKKILKKIGIGVFFLSILVSVKSSMADNVLDPCNIEALDKEGNSYTFELVQTTPGIVIDSNTGVITGSSVNTGDFQLDIRATDEFGAVSDTYNLNLKVNSYCGDKKKQSINDEGRGGPLDDGREDCDGQSGIAINPGDSSPSKQYACTGPCPDNGSCLGTCQATGGYCGDGIVQEEYGETCEPNEARSDIEARIGRSLNDLEISAYRSSCLSNCIVRCPVSDIIGQGCYIDSNNNGNVENTECQKGKYVCTSFGTIKCHDVYTEAGLPAVYDECCRGNGDVLKDMNVEIVRPPDPTPSFYCDEICKAFNKICVGVGLNNIIANNCVYVSHHEGANCNNTVNQTANDCRRTYKRVGSDCVEVGQGVSFDIGETACYCH